MPTTGPRKGYFGCRQTWLLLLLWPIGDRNPAGRIEVQSDRPPRPLGMPRANVPRPPARDLAFKSQPPGSRGAGSRPAVTLPTPTELARLELADLLAFAQVGPLPLGQLKGQEANRSHSSRRPQRLRPRSTATTPRFRRLRALPG